MERFTFILFEVIELRSSSRQSVPYLYFGRHLCLNGHYVRTDRSNGKSFSSSGCLSKIPL